MAKYCLNCGTDLHKKAQACPRCGYPVQKQSGGVLKIVGISLAGAAVVVLLLILFIPRLLSGGDDNRVDQSDSTSIADENTAPSSEPDDSSLERDAEQARDADPGEEEAPTEDLVSAEANQDGATLELTIPPAYVEGDPGELSEQDIANGFLSVRQNDDGSLTYTVDRQKHTAYINQYRKQVQDNLAEIPQSYTSIQEVTTSDDLRTITFVVDREHYERNLDSLAAFRVSVEVIFYHVMAGVPEGQITYVIEVRDDTSGEIFDRISYPEGS